ncbi:unnamed protein product [Rotaria magnacalcarata]|nr:unnamed protein product [Rotaria magnacalcarata]
MNLNRLLEKLHLLNHPFYKAWNEGKLTHESLQLYAQEYYHHVAAFPRYISQIHALCPDISARQILLENLIDEEQGADNHPELWIRFAEGFGVKREEIKQPPELQKTTELVDGYFDLVKADYATGLGALYAYERQTPEVSKSKIDGLKKHYAVSDEKTLQFFSVHEKTDEWHTEELAGLIEKLSETDQEKVLQGATKGAKLLWSFLDGMILDQYIKTVEEEDIIVITSKIISIVQGRLVAKNTISKRSLVYKEADLVLETDVNPYDLYLTIKNDVLIPSAGIDESNIDGFYVLYPENVQETATQIWEYLKKQHNVQKLGIVITDSHTTIMRRGVTGIALGWCGFEPLYSYINKPDLCGNPLRVTQVNILDSLATAAVFVMGEGNEQTPLAIIRDAPKISFLNRIPTVEEQKAIVISMDEDLYAPLLRSANWSKIMDKR